jgi:hypothetical protein
MELRRLPKALCRTGLILAPHPFIAVKSQQPLDPDQIFNL